MTPLRIQLSRRKGWRMPPNTVKVDRTTKWGNSFPAYEYGAARAVLNFRMRIQGLVAINPAYHAIVMGELGRKNLACWCRLCEAHKDGKPLGVECADCAPCHADVLLEIANRDQSEVQT